MSSERPNTAPGKDNPPGLGRYFQGGGTVRSSFAHHLPPPIPSQSSPRTGHFYPSAPAYRELSSLGHTDPAIWASDRPTSNRSTSRWSPTLPGLTLSPRQPGYDGGLTPDPRPGSSYSQFAHHQDRLAPLGEYSQRPTSGWGDPPSTGHSSITSRPPTSYDDLRPSSSQHRQYPPQSAIQPSLSVPPLQRQPSRDRRVSEILPQTPAGASPDLSATRDIPDSPPGDTGKKKKRRIALSCAECAKRKQKCNRETPCQHCVSRRVPELCVPYARNASPAATTSAPAVAEKKDETKTERQDQVDDQQQQTRRSQAQANQAQQEEQPQAQPMTAGLSSSRANPPLPTLSVRVTRLEAMVNTMINHVQDLDGKALQDWRISKLLLGIANHRSSACPFRPSTPRRVVSPIRINLSSD